MKEVNKWAMWIAEKRACLAEETARSRPRSGRLPGMFKDVSDAKWLKWEEPGHTELHRWAWGLWVSVWWHGNPMTEISRRVIWPDLYFHRVTLDALLRIDLGEAWRTNTEARHQVGSYVITQVGCDGSCEKWSNFRRICQDSLTDQWRLWQKGKS